MPTTSTSTTESSDTTLEPIRAVNPATDETLEPSFPSTTLQEADDAAEAAGKAFHLYRETPPDRRAAFLELIAQRLEERRVSIVDCAQLETGLTETRLQGEVDRTSGQLRMFARELRLGIHQDIRIDNALPNRLPAPSPDIRQRHIALGPVVVFGASNFPLAFSTAGGDTASALAAGCPVVVKAHNAHPGTASLVGQAISDAIAEMELPEGTFSQVFGDGQTIGQHLAAHPRIKAIGFTGSRKAGIALMTTAARRHEPIPVYAEMSSINPVLIMPKAAAEIPQPLADGFVASLTLGAGQFCTNPGLVFIPDSAPRFTETAIQEIQKATGQTMLTRGIRRAYDEGVARLSSTSNITVLAEGSPGGTENAPAPVLFETTADYFLTAAEQLQEEIFGSAALLVRYKDNAELLSLVNSLQGQLTATVHGEPDDAEALRAIVPELEDRVGRILFNGWPTGVEVNSSMVHGGPYPATSDSRTTSVGAAAINRFQRPLSYQDMPAGLLPSPLQNSNPWNLPRRVDGEPEIRPGTEGSHEEADT